MAKTKNELDALKGEIDALVEKLKSLDQEEVQQVIENLEVWFKSWEKAGVSVNFEEDTVPVSEKDISAGLRNY